MKLHSVVDVHCLLDYFQNACYLRHMIDFEIIPRDTILIFHIVGTFNK